VTKHAKAFKQAIQPKHYDASDTRAKDQSKRSTSKTKWSSDLTTEDITTKITVANELASSNNDLTKSMIFNVSRWNSYHKFNRYFGYLLVLSDVILPISQIIIMRIVKVETRQQTNLKKFGMMHMCEVSKW